MLFSTVFDISSRLGEFIDNNATIYGIIVEVEPKYLGINLK